MSRLTDVAVEHLREIVLQPTPVASGRRYEIGQIIGEGGMGVVYLAHDRELDRDVALKVLRNPIPTGEERERLLHEARILASLEHPGIVPVHDVGTLSDGRVFYVMKHVRGDRLDEFARANRSRAELLRVFLQVCDAVAFAHAAGIVHRDLKPQNVMLGAFGEVLVLDWGIAKSGAARPAVRRHGTGDLPNTSRAERTMGSAVIGTPLALASAVGPAAM